MKNVLLTIIILGTCLITTAQPDVIKTRNGDLTITPILHATMILQWNGKTIYVDPYGGAEKFADFPNADLILITDIHGDHLNKKTLEGLDTKGADLIAPKAVTEQLADTLFKKIHTLNNLEEAQIFGINVEAIPMYNLPETADSRHPKGRGNGYVLTMGGKRIYISGDTEDIPEMQNLRGIDIAFVCMNMPYTMEVEKAAEAVLAFEPEIVYPFHYRGGGGKLSDVEQFKSLVNEESPEIDVRLRNWYPEK